MRIKLENIMFGNLRLKDKIENKKETSTEILRPKIKKIKTKVEIPTIKRTKL
jgi:hypothetical protein